MNKEDEDIVIDDDPDLTPRGDKEKKLRDKLKVAETKAKEYLDGWQRERAEIANVRRRDEEAKSEFIKFANEQFILELLPVLDSFDMAVGHASTSSAQVALVEPVKKQLLSILESHGLKVSDPAGEKFDPREHESIGSIETNKEDEDHKILEVVQKGYILSDKIIRPAKVKIGEFINN